MSKEYYVYILTNFTHSTLYIGVTGDMEKRLAEHKSGRIKGFSQQYNIKYLVYIETHSDINEAIAREKQLKGWKREKKLALIEKVNPNLQHISS